MKKIVMVALLATVSSYTYAAETAKTDAPKGKGADVMQNLTSDQKACLEKANCPKPAKLEKGVKPTEEQKEAFKAAHKCEKAAFKTCGIEMPKTDKKADMKADKKADDKAAAKPATK